MYLRPPDLKEYGVPKPEANVDAALKVLASHHHQVDTAEVSWAGWVEEVSFRISFVQEGANSKYQS